MSASPQYTMLSSRPMTRHEEKKELSQLNLRYADYIEKVHKLVLQANQSDSSALLAAIGNLEGEVVAIKTMYENELDGLRGELERSIGDGQRLAMSEKKQASLVMELQGRLAAEQKQNQGLMAEMGSMEQFIGKMEMEINQLAGERDGLAKQINGPDSSKDGLMRNFEEVTNKLEEETLAKNGALNALNNLQKKMELQMRLYAEEVGELKSRLDNKGKQILLLEGKLKDLQGRGDNSLQVILARVSETADADLQKYKKDSEAQYTKNLQDLQQQMIQDTGYVAGLGDDNKKLNAAIEDYLREIQLLKNKIRALEQNNGELTANLNQERQKSSAHIQSLEVKLQEIQGMFIHKMQELGSGKEPPIRVEIEALKELLAQEENRLDTLIGQQNAVRSDNPSVIHTSRKTVNFPEVSRSFTSVGGTGGGSTGFGGGSTGFGGGSTGFGGGSTGFGGGSTGFGGGSTGFGGGTTGFGGTTYSGSGLGHTGATRPHRSTSFTRFNSVHQGSNSQPVSQSLQDFYKSRAAQGSQLVPAQLGGGLRVLPRLRSLKDGE